MLRLDVVGAHRRAVDPTTSTLAADLPKTCSDIETLGGGSVRMLEHAPATLISIRTASQFTSWTIAGFRPQGPECPLPPMPARSRAQADQVYVRAPAESSKRPLCRKHNQPSDRARQDRSRLAAIVIMSDSAAR